MEKGRNGTSDQWSGKDLSEDNITFYRRPKWYEELAMKRPEGKKNFQGWGKSLCVHRIELKAWGVQHTDWEG